MTTLTRLLSGALARWLGPEALSSPSGDGAAAAAAAVAAAEQQQQASSSSSSSASSSSEAPNKPAALDKRVLEAHFVWACVWAFGGALLPEAAAAAAEGNTGSDDSSAASSSSSGPAPPSHTDAFARWWVAEWSRNTSSSSSSSSSKNKGSNFAVSFPEGASPFDCFVDPRSGAMTHWASALESVMSASSFASDSSTSSSTSSAASLSSSSSSAFLASAADDAEAALFGSARFVVTAESARLLHVLRTLVAGGFPVLLAGGAGVGKSVLLREALRGGRSVFVGGGGGSGGDGGGAEKKSSRACAAAVGCAVAASSLPLHPLPDPPAVNLVPLSACTSAADLQAALEAPLERKGGTRYGPTAAALSGGGGGSGGSGSSSSSSNNRRLAYLIDDLNAPALDKYGTQSACELLRQALDAGGWYDRAKGAFKEVMKGSGNASSSSSPSSSSVQVAAALNPAAGSFLVSGRLARHFSVFSVAAPRGHTLRSIYVPLLASSFIRPEGSNSGGASSSSSSSCPSSPLLPPLAKLVDATADLVSACALAFVPTTAAPHYSFTGREVASVVAGLRSHEASTLLGSPPSESGGGKASSVALSRARAWAHECERCLRDRLASEADAERFDQMLLAVAAKHFGGGSVGGEEKVDMGALRARPRVFTRLVERADAAAAAADDENSSHSSSSSSSSSPSSKRPPLVEIRSHDELAAAILEKSGARSGDGKGKGRSDLVLFPDAAEHVARLARVLEDSFEESSFSPSPSPSAMVDRAWPHAVLVGVGGSGKQSLARLAARCAGCEVSTLSGGGGSGGGEGGGGNNSQQSSPGAPPASLAEFKAHMTSLFAKAGVRCQRVVLLLVVDGAGGAAADVRSAAGLLGSSSSSSSFLGPDAARILGALNEFAATGSITGLCTPDERDAFAAAARSDVREAGLPDTPRNCWDAFVARVRRRLRLVLCFSPLGKDAALRARLRSCPALTASAPGGIAVDWFHPWPADALSAVAERVLSSGLGGEELSPSLLSFSPSSSSPSSSSSSSSSSSVSPSSPSSASAASVISPMIKFMVGAHEQAAAVCARLPRETGGRKHAYVTPSSFLQLAALASSLVRSRSAELSASRLRLEAGVFKIAAAKEQVDGLRAALLVEQEVVRRRGAETAALLESIGVEKLGADAAAEAGRADEEAAAALQLEVTAVQDECARDLAAAEPAVAAATAALNSLDKASLGELKSFGSPSADVADVMSACMVLTTPKGRPVAKDLSWAAAKKFMGNVDAFLKSLVTFDKENGVSLAAVEQVERDFLSNPAFNADSIRSKSAAAAGLCSWVVNIVRFFRIYQVVAPKRAALSEANSRLAAATAKLADVRSRVAAIRARVAELEAGLVRATDEKNAATAQAARTQAKADLAERLTAGLASEAERWAATIGEIAAAAGATLVGDALLSAAFLAYAGPLGAEQRAGLVSESWVPALRRLGLLKRGGGGGEAAEEEARQGGGGKRGPSAPPSAAAHGAPPASSSPSPLSILADDVVRAAWRAQGLGSDCQSVENGAIVAAAVSRGRVPLLVDPQALGSRWVSALEGASSGAPAEGPSLLTLRQTDDRFAESLAAAAEAGRAVLVEGLGEDLDPALVGVVKQLSLGGGRDASSSSSAAEAPASCSSTPSSSSPSPSPPPPSPPIHPSFRLYLCTRLASPHYPPETAAQVSIVDFGVTRQGLEEQLLARVVDHERPELQEAAARLQGELGSYAGQLVALEDDLLARLAAASGDILSDSALVEQLEATKRTAADVASKQAAARAAEAGIAAARAAYSPAARRAALLHQLVSALPALDRVYYFSMDAFVRAMARGMDRASSNGSNGDENATSVSSSSSSSSSPSSASVARRVDALVEAITRSVFDHVSAGLFERHKLAFAARLTMAVLQEREAERSKSGGGGGGGSGDAAAAVLAAKLDLLLKPTPATASSSSSSSPPPGPSSPASAPPPGESAPPSWLPASSWASLAALRSVPGLESLAEDVAGAPKRWSDWVERERPEAEPLPGDWRRLPELERLLVFRALRPDRLASAMRRFVGGVLGPHFVSSPKGGGFDLDAALSDGGGGDASPATPVLVFLSPGVDAAAAVQAAAASRGLSPANGGYAAVSLGQGQEEAASRLVARAAREGGWVLLQNVHLTMDWTSGPLAVTIDRLAAAASAASAAASPAAVSASSSSAASAASDAASPAAVSASSSSAAPEGASSAAAAAAAAAAETPSSSSSPPPTATTFPHPRFQLFLSAEPPPALERPLPQSLLSACVELTIEPPDGLKASVVSAYASCFDDAFFEACSKPAELRSIAAALAFFHGVALQRRRFGVGNALGARSGLGWAAGSPFSGGDLACAARTAAACLDAGARVPWADLRYLVGEILYGGHVVEDADRGLVAAYLRGLLHEGLLEGTGGAAGGSGGGRAPSSSSSSPAAAPATAAAAAAAAAPGGPLLCPGLRAPSGALSHRATLEYFEDAFPPESAACYGLHANAEIGCRLREAEAFCQQMLCLGGGGGGAGGGGGGDGAPSSGRADDAAVLEVVAEVLRRLPPAVVAVEVSSSSGSSSSGSAVRAARGKAAGRNGAIALVADASSGGEAGDTAAAAAAAEAEAGDEESDPSLSPIAAVALQEAAALNELLSEVRRSLAELQRALAGQSAWSPAAEALARSLAAREVPPAWMALSGPTLRPLEGWLDRTASWAAQLVEWLRGGSGGNGGGSAANNGNDAGDVAAESAPHPASVPPRVVWLPGLSSPRAFLTAVTQAAARRNGWPLDATSLVVEPVKRGGVGGVSDAAAAAAAAFVPSGFSSSSSSSALSSLPPPPKDCVYLCGLAIEGGRWDERAGCLDDPRPRELLSRLPLLVARPMPADRAAAMLSTSPSSSGSSSGSSSTSNYFACPVYATAARFRQEVATLHLRLPARSQASKWTLAGTAAFLEADGM